MAELIFRINDIQCEKCIEKIRHALENLPGLEELYFDFEEKILKVQGETDPIAIDQVIQDSGFNPVQIYKENNHS